MKKQDKLTLALETVSFEYFKNCIKNGATPEQAKKEMLTEEAQKTIAKRVKEVLV